MGETDPSQGGVVVPALVTPSSVACIRSLGRHGIRVIAISEQRRPPGFSSKYTDEIVRVPDPNRDLGAYKDMLLGLAKRRDVQTIIPVREADIYTLAKYKSEFAKHVGTPWVSMNRLRRVQDRVELFDAAAAAGVAAPETRPLDEWDDWDREVIVKPRYTVHAPEYSEEFAESRTHGNSTRYLEVDGSPPIDEIVAEMGHVPLVQEYVPDSDEYAFFALYDHGRPLATFQHRQRRGYKYSGGPSAFRESTNIPELDEAGRRLLDKLDWHGLAMVEFLRDPTTGEFKLMEINPRFWTSLPFTVQAGVDFPYYYWLQSLGREDEIVVDYDVGIAGHLLRGEFLYLHSILFDEFPLVERPSLPGAFRDVAVTLWQHPRFDYLSRDDPRPFVRDAINAYRYARGEQETV